MPTYKGKVKVGAGLQPVTVEAANGSDAMKLLKMQYGDNARTWGGGKTGPLTRA